MERTLWLSPFMKGGNALCRFTLLNEKLIFNEEHRLSDEELVRRTQGTFTTINGDLIAVFTQDHHNFLYTNGLFGFTPALSVDHHCGEDYEESRIVIWNGDDLIYENHFINPFEPVMTDFPDWCATNFAHYIARYAEMVKKDPACLLFGEGRF